jgi:hypothetical protein
MVMGFIISPPILTVLLLIRIRSIFKFICYYSCLFTKLFMTNQTLEFSPPNQTTLKFPNKKGHRKAQKEKTTAQICFVCKQRLLRLLLRRWARHVAKKCHKLFSACGTSPRVIQRQPLSEAALVVLVATSPACN